LPIFPSPVWGGWLFSSEMALGAGHLAWASVRVNSITKGIMNDTAWFRNWFSKVFLGVHIGVHQRYVSVANGNIQS
jgi:hypothetical protein